MPRVKHPYHSAKGDGPDSTLVKPSDWNQDHDLLSTSPLAVYLGQDATGAGPVKEFPVNHAATGDDMTIYTKAMVDAAIAAALANVDVPATGDLCASLASGKSNWIIADGRTIGNVGSTAIFANANALNLFTLLWNLNGGTWPVFDAFGAPARGGTASADWAALKKVPLPDARGCVLGMIDLSAGVNALITQLGVGYAKTGLSLDITNIPPHTHPMNTPSRPAFNNGIGGGGGGNSLWDTGGPSLAAAAAGGDPAAVPPYSVPKAFVPNQPTMGANIFVKL
jgi:hypothetical protein